MGVFSQFEKKIIQRKRKKNSNFVYPGLRYAEKKTKFACKKIFLESVCLSKKFNLRLRKKSKNVGAISILS